MFFTRLLVIFILHSLMVHFNCVMSSECADGDYTYDPYDCNAYLQCLFGAYVRRLCPANLHFNRFINSCDFPDQANCVIETTTAPLPPTTSTTTTYSPGEPPTTTVPPTATTPDPADPTIPTSTTGPPSTTTTTIAPPITTTTIAPPTTTTIAPPITTTTIVISTTTTIAPPTGPPITAPPITTSPPTIPPTPAPTITPPTTTPFTTTTPDAETVPTPAPTLPDLTTTLPPDATPTPPYPPIPSECPRVDGPYVIHLPHPNCSMFYKCGHGIPHEMLCPDNQFWSVALDRCEIESVANCIDGLAPEQPGARPPNYW